MAASVLITARSTRPAKHQPPASRDARTGVEIKFWRRFIYTAIYEAQVCRAGQPTGNAILQRHWIESKVEKNHTLYGMSWDDACLQAGRNADDARKRALAMITRAWIKAGREEWQIQYEHNRNAVLSCAGVDAATKNQAVLALVAIVDYDDVAMPEDDEPILPFIVN